jgi:secreted trypsin-like serine protease
MKALLILALVGLIDARPSAQFFPRFTNRGIVGGEDAGAGEFPWQLSQQRQGSTGNWGHSCGASLLDNSRVLSAAHCVDGAQVDILRVVAGLHQRSNMVGTQTSNVAFYIMHEEYDQVDATYGNDIAIIHLLTPITTGSTIQPATLPPDDTNDFGGQSCVISGWGRTSNSNDLPDVLQKASIGVLTTLRCRANMAVTGATIWEKHICLLDEEGLIGSCNGDSGGPLNCALNGGTVVAGVTSWGIQGILGNCQQARASVYTRTSAYLEWIADN